MPEDLPAVSPSYLQLTEDGIKTALIEARGDIFIASQLLGVTAVRLERSIGVSDLLRASLEAAREASTKQGVVTDAEIRQAVDRRVAVYRVTGLDALADLASMPIDKNSAQNQVKLAAAARLAGTTEAPSGSGDVESTLRELNAEYAKAAPRLRVIRERTTIETLPPERVVGSEGDPV